MPPKDTNVPVILEKHSKRRCRGRVTDSGLMQLRGGLERQPRAPLPARGRTGPSREAVSFLKKKKEFTFVHSQKTAVIPVNVLASCKYSEVTLLQVPPWLWECVCSDSSPLVNWWQHVQLQLDKFDRTSLTHINWGALYNIVNYI